MSSEFDVEDLEKTLCQIRDVKAARIVTGRDRAIDEIHIIALPTKGPKQLARDVESALMARYGVSVNHKKISIAQIEQKELTRDRARPKIVSIDAELVGVQAKVSVVLALSSRDYEGVATGPASYTGRTRLVALATLDAVEKIVQGSYGFALEDVTIVKLGRESVATACVVLVSPLGEEIFSGSAVVKQNENDAVVRATLDAINRRFGSLITA